MERSSSKASQVGAAFEELQVDRLGRLGQRAGRQQKRKQAPRNLRKRAKGFERKRALLWLTQLLRHLIICRGRLQGTRTNGRWARSRQAPAAACAARQLLNMGDRVLSAQNAEF
jgi:hypothetical protein